jgi:membrane protein
MTFPPIRLEQAWNLGGLSVRELAVRTWRRIQDHELMTRAAAISFYAMLAFVPFLALVITLAVQALPDLTGRSAEAGMGDLTVGRFENVLKTSLPAEGYKIVHDQIARIQEDPPVGLLSIGLLITIWTASSLFVAIIDAMNVVYGVRETRPFWKLRLTAIVMTLIQAAVLLSALVSIAAWPLILGALGLGGGPAILATAVQWVLVFVMIAISFAMTFYVAPDADQRWEWITPGSLLGTVVFLAGSFGFSLYVRYFGSYDKTYGSLGGVMVLLFWFWVSSLVLLSAGQMNKVIEDAAPMGKKEGQKHEPAAGKGPDLALAERS